MVSAMICQWTAECGFNSPHTAMKLKPLNRNIVARIRAPERNLSAFRVNALFRKVQGWA
jgi:hypothetical protein